MDAASVFVTVGEWMMQEDVLSAIVVEVHQPGVVAVAGQDDGDVLMFAGKEVPARHTGIQAQATERLLDEQIGAAVAGDVSDQQRGVEGAGPDFLRQPLFMGCAAKHNVQGHPTRFAGARRAVQLNSVDGIGLVSKAAPLIAIELEFQLDVVSEQPFQLLPGITCQELNVDGGQHQVQIAVTIKVPSVT